MSFSPAPKPKNKRFKPKKKRNPDMQEATIGRDGRCVWCGRIDDTLVGHHIQSWGSSGIDETENMVTLCGKCHGDVGNGYLDMSVCNVPRVLEKHRDQFFLGASRTGGVAKLNDPDKILKEILEWNLQNS